MSVDQPPGGRAPAKWYHALPARLFIVTAAMIMLVELLIFFPSAANYRDSWLMERVEAGEVAAIALSAAPERRVSKELSKQLLKSAEVMAVGLISEERGRELLLGPTGELEGELVEADLRGRHIGERLYDLCTTYFAFKPRYLRVLAEPRIDIDADIIEVVIPEKPMRDDLIAFSWRILAISLFITITAAGVLYFLLMRAVVSPVISMTRALEVIGMAPGRAHITLKHLDNRDEIGRAERALQEMDVQITQAIHQRERLAQLGEAVAKITHDLRNSLTSAQLLSESLEKSEDPRVQKVVPRLERSLSRATQLATATLQYGKAEKSKLHIEAVKLKAAISDALYEGLGGEADISHELIMDDEAALMADSEALHRILVNLIRNAASALREAKTPEARLKFELQKNDHLLHIEDNGPGIGEAIKTKLFKPFEASASKDGTGLGLNIARELAEQMGGALTLKSTSPEGTCFELKLPEKS